MLPYPVTGSPAGQHSPDRLDPHEKLQLRAAAHRAKQLYPGPVGDLVAAELLDWGEFGYRFTGRTAHLLQHVLTTPLPAHTPEGE